MLGTPQKKYAECIGTTMNMIKKNRELVYQEKPVETYKGCFINRIFPSGYYEAYIDGRFYKADDVQELKDIIDTKHKRERERAYAQQSRAIFS